MRSIPVEEKMSDFEKKAIEYLDNLGRKNRRKNFKESDSDDNDDWSILHYDWKQFIIIIFISLMNHLHPLRSAVYEYRQ